MAQVRKFGDPVLKTKARPVKEFDDALRAQIDRMAVLMHDGLGIGLAATQVGVLNRVLVYRVDGQAPVAAIVNPEIEWRSSDTGDRRGGVPEPAARSTSRSSDRSTFASAPGTASASRS